MAVRSVEPETSDTTMLSLDELRARLRAVGEERYHHKHPFHLMMHEGRLSRGQLQAWALNRYYYQSIIPVKDSIILSRGPDPAFRRSWRKRVIDHDGDAGSEGGIRRWLKLAEATGLDATTFALVKVASLIALDAPPASYAWQISNALEEGVTAEDFVGVLRAIAPQVGGPRIIAAAPEIMVAMGLQLDEEGRA